MYTHICMRIFICNKYKIHIMFIYILNLCMVDRVLIEKCRIIEPLNKACKCFESIPTYIMEKKGRGVDII